MGSASRRRGAETGEEGKKEAMRAVDEARKNLAQKQGVLDLMERTLMSPMQVAGTTVVPIEG